LRDGRIYVLAEKNHPIELSSNAVIDQKIEYVHNNPVEAGIVTEPESYYYSSANPLFPLKICEE
jgi:hypothetical protein